MHKISIQFFGLLAEITGSHTLELEGIPDTDRIREAIQRLFPQLRKQHYMLAINNRLIHENTTIGDNCRIACMPPFSGG